MPLACPALSAGGARPAGNVPGSGCIRKPGWADICGSPHVVRAIHRRTEPGSMAPLGCMRTFREKIPAARRARAVQGMGLPLPQRPAQGHRR